MGVKPSEFWLLTPSELSVMAEGYVKKQRTDINELLYLAWHTAAFSRTDKLPSLKSLMQEETKTHEQQTDEQMMAMCKMLNAAFGGEVVET